MIELNTRSLMMLALSSLLLGSSALAQTADTQDQASPASVVISLQKISCQSCGAAVVKLLERQRGVESAEFDRDSVEIEVSYDPSLFDADDLTSLVHGAGYSAVVGGSEGSYAPALDFPEDLDVEWLSRVGEDADLEAGVVPGKVTVFDFYAVWCGPCREVDREMRSILESSSDVALRKLNVVDWSSPIAAHYLKRASALPYVVVYGTNGSKVDAIEGLNLKRLRRAIEKGRRG
jgi:thioredoxin 1